MQAALAADTRFRFVGRAEIRQAVDGRVNALAGHLGQQALAPGGLTVGRERWRGVAGRWVRGDDHEADRKGKPFDAATLVVRVSVWDGRH